MPTRSALVNAFWQAFRRHTGLDHDNYAVASFGDFPQMATELADLVMAGIKRATVSLARDYGEGCEPIPKAGDFVMMLDGEGLHGSSGVPRLSRCPRLMTHLPGTRARETARE